MSIATELSRIRDAKDAIRDSIIDKGVFVPEAAKIDTYAARIDEIVQQASGNMEVITASPSGTINAVDNRFYLLSNTAGALVFNLPTISTGAHGIYLMMETGSNSVVSFTCADGSTVTIPQGFSIVADKCYLLDFEYINGGWTMTADEWFVTGGTDQWESIYASVLSGTGPTALNSSTVPSSVTSIKKYAFYNDTGLLSVNLPSVTNIVDAAFSNCTNLTTVTLGTSPVLLDYAFSNCTNLTTVTTSDGYIAPQNYAFSNCTNLVNIPRKVILNYGAYQFYGCTSLTGDVTISCTSATTSNDAIGNNAFQNTKLRNVVFDNSWSNVYASVGYNMFYECEDVDSITLPNVVNINNAGSPSGAKGFCSSILRSFTLPTQKSTTIPNCFFSGFKVMGIMTIPQNFKTIKDSALNPYSCIYKFVSETPAKITNNYTVTSNWSSPILVPDNAVDTYKTASKWSAAAHAIKPYSWTGPDTGYKAELWRIASPVVNPISSSESTVISSSETSLSSVRYVVIGSEATGIDANAFKNNTDLCHLDMRFATGLTSIGASAFQGCSSLFNIIGIENATSLTSLGDLAFATTALKYINFPYVTSLGNDVFKGCSKLVEITANDLPLVTSIQSTVGGNYGAFASCTKLRKAVFGSNLESVKASGLFYRCTALEECDFSNTKITTLSSMNDEQIPFKHCSNFKRLKLPATFVRCPWGIEYYSPVYNISSFNELWLYSPNPPSFGSTSGNMFKGTKLETKDPDQAAIYVPAASVDAYKSATGWSAYSAIIKPMPAE